jgi:hypothetical protein
VPQADITFETEILQLLSVSGVDLDSTGIQKPDLIIG